MGKFVREQRKAEEFLERCGMGYRSIDILACAEEFRAEMERGLKGEGGSLRMIPTFYSPVRKPKNEAPILVLDAGGTNLRAAIVRLSTNGDPLVEKHRSCPMPGIREEITADKFFRRTARFIAPLVPESFAISFCFSYASRPTPELDGIAEEMGKQLKVAGMEGRSLAHGLGEALKKEGIREEKRIFVLNDAAATLMGGAAASGGRPFDGYVGFILGTGLNVSYVERADRIAELRAMGDLPVIVNTESGNYSRFPRGKMDRMYDDTLRDTGKWQFEKMVSGRFQGGLLHTVLRQAVSEGLFSKQFMECFSAVRSLTSRQIDEFLDFPAGNGALASCCSDTRPGDAVLLYYLIDALNERAARLVAANLAAVLVQSGGGENPLRPVCITADGSTFYKSKLFRGKLDYYVRTCITDQLGIFCEFHRTENVNLIGAAAAAGCMMSV